MVACEVEIVDWVHPPCLVSTQMWNSLTSIGHLL